jgi:Zn-dependent protease with chaperone function
VSDAPAEYKQRAESAMQAVSQCYPESYGYELYYVDSEAEGAWCESPNKIYVAFGLFGKYDDEALRFIMAHEIAHLRLGHHAEIRTASIATTGVMMVANVFIPGSGLLNHAVNPAVTRSFSRGAELEADKAATEISINCLKIHKNKVIRTLSEIPGEGGFWSTHPSGEERIKNISKPQ